VVEDADLFGLLSISLLPKISKGSLTIYHYIQVRTVNDHFWKDYQTHPVNLTQRYHYTITVY